MLMHLGGPEWASEGSEESSERRKRTESHRSDVVIEWNVSQLHHTGGPSDTDDSGVTAGLYLF